MRWIAADHPDLSAELEHVLVVDPGEVVRDRIDAVATIGEGLLEIAGGEVAGNRATIVPTFVEAEDASVERRVI